MISLYQGLLLSTFFDAVNCLTYTRFLGAAIMIISLVLFENEFLNIVAISFTALILNELIMVALEITIWYVRLYRASFFLFVNSEFRRAGTYT